jgi:Na+/proline symporter
MVEIEITISQVVFLCIASIIFPALITWINKLIDPDESLDHIIERRLNIHYIYSFYFRCSNLCLYFCGLYIIQRILTICRSHDDAAASTALIIGIVLSGAVILYIGITITFLIGNIRNKYRDFSKTLVILDTLALSSSIAIAWILSGLWQGRNCNAKMFTDDESYCYWVNLGFVFHVLIA